MSTYTIRNKTTGEERTITEDELSNYGLSSQSPQSTGQKIAGFVRGVVAEPEKLGRAAISIPMLAGSTIAGRIASAYKGVTGNELKSLSGKSVEQNALNQANWVEENVLTPKQQQVYSSGTTEEIAGEAARMGVGTASFLTPAGYGAGAKTVESIAPTFAQSILKFAPPAVQRILTIGGETALSGGLYEASRESATPGSVAKAGLTSFLFGSGMRTGGEALGKLAGGTAKNAPKKLISSYTKPPTSALQLKETEESLKYGKKMLGEQIIEKGDLTTSPEKLWKIGENKRIEAGKAMSEVVKNSDVRISVEDIGKALDEQVLGMDELIKQLPADKQKAIANILGRDLSSRVTELKNSFATLADKDGKVSASAVDLLQNKLDAGLHKAYDLAKQGVDMTPEDAVATDLADILRDILNTNVKGLKEYNQAYGYSKSVVRATLPVISKKIHTAPLGDIMLVGMGGASAMALAPGDALTKLLAGIGAGFGGAVVAKSLRNPTLWFTLATLLNKAGTTGQQVTQAGMTKGPELVGRSLSNFLKGNR